MNALARRTKLATCALAVTAQVAVAQSPSPRATQTGLSRDEVIALSVLPLPEQLRAGATVDSLDDRGRPIELRKATNGMVCVRMVPGEAEWDARCYHESFIPLFFRRGELRRQGLKEAEATLRMNEAVRTGALPPPPRPTAGYRILGSAAAYDPKTGKSTAELSAWQSIHMPFQTAADLGLPDEATLTPGQRDWMPFVMAGGTWWSHVMIKHPGH